MGWCEYYAVGVGVPFKASMPACFVVGWGWRCTHE